MAQQINCVVIGGNLTRDPELRSTPSGMSVCSLRIANNRRRKIGGEWQSAAGYFDVTVWGNQGENCAQYLSKGRGVLVRGELRWREWETRSGDKRQSVEVNADEVQFLNDGDRSEREPARQLATDVPADTTDLDEPPAAAGGGYGSGGYGTAGDDDIPFAASAI